MELPALFARAATHSAKRWSLLLLSVSQRRDVLPLPAYGSLQAPAQCFPYLSCRTREGMFVHGACFD